MCGRYNFTVEQNDEIIEILEKLNAKLHKKAVKNGEINPTNQAVKTGEIFPTNQAIKTGEIYPTNQAPILIEEEQEVTPTLSNWGFPKFNQKGVIINARAESAFEKKTFRDSLVNRRCIIPSTGFYEWDSEKKKYLFQLEGTNILYMAGVYTYYKDELRFVILTTAANESMKEIHNRMPLVIPKQETATWIKDYGATNELLKRIPPQLVRQEIKESGFGYQYKMDL